VLPTGGPCTAAEPPRGALGMLLHATSLLIGQRFAGEAPALGRRAGVTILPPPCPVGVQPMDFGHSAELIARGEASARAFLRQRSADVVPIEARRGGRRPRVAAADELPSAG
jgi:NTE family protein